ncbi:MAG: electron transfer flavoprotein subunit beta/FixA family protein [Halobacteriota archaeon]
MKVLVSVKEVATVGDDFEIEGTSIPERYLEYDLNEWDDYAVEEAVQLAESADDVEVVAVTIGPPRVEETVRIALAKGVDRAIRVWDDALADQQLLDVSTKASILAAVVEAEEPDIVFAGVQADDDAFGATGVALAAAADYQWAAVVNAFELEGDDTAAVHRELEGGLEELTTVDLPAVFTIQTGINEPRYASLRGIRMAQQKEIDAVDLDDLGLEADGLDGALELTSMAEPETESEVTLFEGGADDTAGQLAELLDELGVIGA